MADLKLIAASFETDYQRIDYDRIADAAVRKVAVGFFENMKRLHVMALLPARIVDVAINWERSLCMASVNVLGRIVMPLPPESQNNVLAESRRLLESGNQARLNLTREAAAQIYANAISDLTQILGISPPVISEGMEGILAAQIIGAWTAFESLATDLWIAAVNVRPMTLGTEAFQSPRPSDDREDPTPVEETAKKKADAIKLDTLRHYPNFRSSRTKTAHA